ncbi:hypothetical protein WA026_013671 [Henosepilachna vigintioctopunctata]|uniref:Uncharacterized protein n=1 Tax=Henosepilachna vigintioctopunctata TaxID=420089 RepID=A0AAW1UZA7_9CUCU
MLSQASVHISNGKVYEALWLFKSSWMQNYPSRPGAGDKNLCHILFTGKPYIVDRVHLSDEEKSFLTPRGWDNPYGGVKIKRGGVSNVIHLETYFVDQTEELNDDEIGHHMDDLELNSDIDINSSSEDSDSEEEIETI